LHPALKFPLSQSELEHLASTVESKLRSTGWELFLMYGSG
jgi:hypothetical protein